MTMDNALKPFEVSHPLIRHTLLSPVNEEKAPGQ